MVTTYPYGATYTAYFPQQMNMHLYGYTPYYPMYVSRSVPSMPTRFVYPKRQQPFYTMPQMTTMINRIKYACSTACCKSDGKADTPDIFMDNMMIRSLGYANEGVEIAKQLVSKSVYSLGYLTTALYAGAHVLFTGVKAFQNTEGKDWRVRVLHTVDQMTDVGLFQLGASVLIPPQLIKGIKWVGQKIAQNHLKSPTVRRWFPMGLALGALPLMIKPIDALVENALTHVYRPLMCRMHQALDKQLESKDTSSVISAG